MIGIFPKISVPDWLLHCVTNRREQLVLTLIDNGKLANHIARLQAIVVKKTNTLQNLAKKAFFKEFILELLERF